MTINMQNREFYSIARSYLWERQGKERNLLDVAIDAFTPKQARAEREEEVVEAEAEVSLLNRNK